MTDFESILDEAHTAAGAAIAAMPPEDMNALDCGFAWVMIDGNSPLARHCRKMIKAAGGERHANRKFGSKGYPSGWQFWKPGGFGGQAIGHHEAGAKAFRDVLARHGIRADVGSRFD